MTTNPPIFPENESPQNSQPFWTEDQEVEQEIVPVLHSQGPKLMSIVGVERVILAIQSLEARLESAKQYVRDVQSFKKKKEETLERGIEFLKGMIKNYLDEKKVNSVSTMAGTVSLRKPGTWHINASEENIWGWINGLPEAEQEKYIKIEKSLRMKEIKDAVSNDRLQCPFPIFRPTEPEVSIRKPAAKLVEDQPAFRELEQ